MGRKLRRVPLDFNWPRKKVWVGFMNPHNLPDCPACKGRGESPEVRRWYDRWYGDDTEEDYVWCDETHEKRWNRAAWMNNIDDEDIQALLAANRLWEFTRVPRTEEQRLLVEERMEAGENSWLPFNNGYVPTADEVNAYQRQYFLHDGINAGAIVEAKAKKWGQPTKCQQCQGKGHTATPEEEAAFEAWEPEEPPMGEGWQLWENTTEGSPLSPVFATLDLLCGWCEEHETVFASSKVSAAEWKQMLEKNFVYHQQGNTLWI